MSAFFYRLCLYLVPLVTVLFVSIETKAQVINDDCFEALRLCPETPLTSTTAGATTQCGSTNDPDGDCLAAGSWGQCYNVNNSVWFYFDTDPDGGTVFVTVNGLNCSPTTDQELSGAIVRATTACDATTYTPIACIVRSATGFVLAAPALSGNTRYYVQIDGDNVPTTLPPAECGFTVSITGTGVQPCCPPPVVNNVVIVQSDFCNQNVGVATVELALGTGPHTFSWTNAAGALVSTDSLLTGAAGGTYTLVITAALGCTTTTNVSVPEVNAPTIGTPFTTNATCNLANGSGTFLFSGGLPPYSYQWANSTSPSVVIATSPGLSNVAGGTYVVTVTNSDGSCPTIGTLNINNIGIAPVIDSISVVPATCLGNDGGLIAHVSGGQPPFQFAWQAGGGGPVFSSSTITGATPQTYLLTVLNFDGTCPTNGVQSVNQIDNSPTIADTVVVASDCDVSNGSILIVPSNGVLPYGYSWTNLANPSLALPATNPLNNIPAGNYSVTLTNSGNTCPTVHNILVPSRNGVVITGFVAVDSAGCQQATGTATVLTLGGLLPLNYLWDNGETTATALALGGGIHSVTVSNNNGSCPTIGQVVIPERSPYFFTDVLVTPDNCNSSDGTVTLAAAGGSGVYTYALLNSSGGLIGTVVGNTVTNLPAGTYTARVADNAGLCPAFIQVEVPAVAAPSGVPVTVSPATCDVSDGSATLVITTGVPPFSFAWTLASDTLTVLSTDSVATGLHAGLYMVFVTNSNGSCRTRIPVIVPSSGGPVVTTFVISAAGCNGQPGSAAPIVSGGVPPYQYAWTDPANPGALLSSDSLLVVGFTPGTYPLTVFNADSTCAFWTAAFINAPPVIERTITQDAGCDPSRGTATAIVSGGVAPYQYLWTLPTSPTDTLSVESLIDSLSAGSYLLTITDAISSCVVTATAVVRQAPRLTPVAPFVFPSICSPNNGYANIQVLDGTPGYQYEWRTEEGRLVSTSARADRLAPDEYTITVRDTNLCTFTLPFEVFGSVPPAVRIGYQVDSIRWYTDTVYIEAGDTLHLFCETSANHRIRWLPVAGLDCNTCPIVTTIPAGTITYRATVTDSLSCDSTVSITIVVRPSDYLATVPTAFTPNGDNINDQIYVNGHRVKQVNFFRIYDRWGQRVFEALNTPANDRSFGWDGTVNGKLLAPEVFVYQAEVTFENSKKYYFKGSFQLLN